MKADIYDVIFFLMKISKCFSPSILPGANVIKITVVIYHHSMAILPFRVKKQYYLGNYCEKALNYDVKKFYNIDSWCQS